MTAEEIRKFPKSYAASNATLDYNPILCEIALQLALLNEKAERIAAAMERGQTELRKYSLAEVPIPEGWHKVGFREPRFNEYFMSDTGGIGLQDGGVSFAGRDPVHIIVERTTEVPHA